MKRLQVAVIGSAGLEEYPGGSSMTDRILKEAERIGSLLAQANAIVITGGKGGIMEAAAKGAKSSGGITIGVVSREKRFTSNQYTDVEVVSGAIGNGLDEYLLVLMSDALISIGGGAGTLQEIALAYRNNKPLVILRGSMGWSDKVADSYLDERRTRQITAGETAEEVVRLALDLARP